MNSTIAPAARNSTDPAPPIGGRITTTMAAALMNVSVRGIERARRVQRLAPDLADRVLAGELSNCQAENIIKERMGERPDKLLEAVILAHTAIKRLRQLAGPECADSFAEVYAAGDFLGEVRQLAKADRVAR